ncbi:fermentation-respiration switch protein FrsA (DUF1100 family) [Xanthomonas arboricola]|uniref:alpha/beta hydrolase n=1 Tax=Xanthomonas sp. 3793 TaxID=3035312 RepID=UPI0021675C2D|nr:alpha/beta hydrolase [Xanthomonas sp. 3793]MCS3744618.1 fermentation-respiration switch protein FrsA (DUF1100 family) [Xanthomonas sp. 3793]
MKHIVHPTLLAVSLGLAAGNATAADYRLSPFKLAYESAVTRNVLDEVNVHSVSYPPNGIEIAANFYTAASFDASRKYPTIVVAHPNGGVKEQVAGLYAQRLAGQGYIAITADAAYQGASGGQPPTFYARTLAP